MLTIGSIVKIDLPKNPTTHNRIGSIIEIDDNCYDETVYLVKYLNQVSGSGWFTEGAVKIIKDLDDPIEGKNVIIIEDIVDSGITLNYLKNYLLSMEPKTLKICAFLDKPTGRQIDIDIDYTGFVVPDKFIVGYGLDYAQQYRNLPYVTCLTGE